MKELLGNAINLSMDECTKEGMFTGCSSNCPIYKVGKCPIQKENEDFFKEQN